MFEWCKDGFVLKVESQSGIIFPDRADLRSVGTSAIGNGLLHIVRATGLTEIQNGGRLDLAEAAPRPLRSRRSRAGGRQPPAGIPFFIGVPNCRLNEYGRIGDKPFFFSGVIFK